ncbi:MAG TPA: hypothetical protein VK985_14955 [Rariglobus sp.]|nr:hypothetical protein [Rariglobus sp.]
MSIDLHGPLRLLRRLGLGGIMMFAALPAAPAQSPANSARLIDFDASFTTVEADWTGRARVDNQSAVLDSCGPKGSASYDVTRDFSAYADDSLALLLKVGPRNTAKTLCVQIRDQDQHECLWFFTLPGPGTEFEWVKADNGASLLLPNRADMRDYSINDLRRISRITLRGNFEQGRVLDVQIAGIFAVKPDADTLAARETLRQDTKKREENLRTRDLLAARFVASFPELNSPHPAPVADKRILRGYHIGNSLTFKALSYPYTVFNKPWTLLAYEQRVIAFMNARGVRYVPGWHISWGASLPSLWNTRFNPAVANAGPAEKALGSFNWDVLTLQLWGADAAGDVEAARKFIETAVAKNPEIQVYLVETWVEKNDKLVPDYATQWNREWKPDQKFGVPPIHCAAYAKTVFSNLQKASADLRHPVRLIPIGSVLYELDKRMRAGEIAGYTRVEELYQDKVHLNETGNYVALETFSAVILGQNPQGLPRTDLFPSITDSFAAVVQEVVWKVVTSTPETGVVIAR